MFDLSLVLCSIRPNFLESVYTSALKSCKSHSFELLIISPYQLPESLNNIKQIRYFEEWGSPTRASQIGALECAGTFLTFPCDDGTFIENSLDLALDLAFSSCGHKDGLVCRYKEGPGRNAASFPLEYWNMNHHIGLGGLNLENDWKIAPQPMIRTEYFKEIGGFDCEYEACSWASWDISARLQRDGGKFLLSPTEIMDADNYGDLGNDHAPIFHAHSVDHTRFINTYSNPEVKNRVKINFDNWENTPKIWSRRWINGKPSK